MMNNEANNIYWVGPRESDIDVIHNLLAGSITIFGSNQNANRSFSNFEYHKTRVDHNNIDLSTDDNPDAFLRNTIIATISKDDKARFVFYNGNAFESIGMPEKYRPYMLCLNDGQLMRQLNNKFFFHDFLGVGLPLVDVIKRNIADCYYTSISRLLNADTSRRFVVQAPVASGGSGTFIMDNTNEAKIKNLAKPNGEEFLVSIYQEKNVPVNIHAIIFEEEILFTPGSVQIMREDANRLMYRGADFVAFRSLPKEALESFYKSSIEVCKRIQNLGYRGVCGIDAIIFGHEVRLLEINNRFQSSTAILNMALKDNKLRSIYEINMDAFNLKKPRPDDYAIHNIEVNYSNYAYIYNDTLPHSDHILDTCHEDPNYVCLELDGYVRGLTGYAANTHLYRIVFRSNICWISPDNATFLNETIADPKKAFMDSIIGQKNEAGECVNRDMLALKIALLTQGVVVKSAALNQYAEDGGIRPATNSAVDIKIDNPIVRGKKIPFIVINAPRGIKYNAMAPFSIDLVKGALKLFYYDFAIVPIYIYPIDPLSVKVTEKHGISYSEIAYLSTDRLRVHLSNQCIYKKVNKSCKFCDIPITYGDIPIEDIKEVLEDYKSHAQELGLKHFLIGGQSTDEEIAKEKLVQIVRVIRSLFPTEGIYAMVLPYDRDTIARMYNAGLNEMAFNIEIFDEKYAHFYMPGKGYIPRSTYFKALAVATCSKYFVKGNVRSMVIVGLEPHESMINGIKKLVENSVQPILSIFRPLFGTPLTDIVPPPMEYLYKLFNEVEDICASKGMNLGPKCLYCQNNTLSLPY